MDYGFAPNGDRQDARLRTLFQRRVNTTLIHRPNLSTLHGFIDHLAANVQLPIENAVLGSHANSEGLMYLRMYPNQGRDDYDPTGNRTGVETLQKTLDTPARSVDIDAVISTTGNHFVHFKGCNIGRAPKFLVKFKEALGGNVSVTAPKHFHGIAANNREGSWEYMAYEFSIRRPTAFTGRTARADLVAAFEGTGGFEFIDHTPVPTDRWNAWIPQNVTRFAEIPVVLPLGTTTGQRTTLGVARQFRVDQIPFPWTEEYDDPANIPATNAARQAAFEAVIRAADEFNPLYAFPWYERLGYASVNAFFAGYTWTHAVRGNLLVTTGRRAEYTVVIPIVDPTDDHLFFNFHPLRNTPYTPITQMPETNTDFFTTV